MDHVNLKPGHIQQYNPQDIILISMILIFSHFIEDPHKI